MKKRKIGILGGTFDPIHRVHLSLAKQAKEQYHLEEVWLMPSGDPPHKSGKTITPGAKRLKLVELAVSNQSGLVASDYELRRKGKIYTAETLEQLSAEQPVFYYGRRFPPVFRRMVSSGKDFSLCCDFSSGSRGMPGARNDQIRRKTQTAFRIVSGSQDFFSQDGGRQLVLKSFADAFGKAGAER